MIVSVLGILGSLLYAVIPVTAFVERLRVGNDPSVAPIPLSQFITLAVSNGAWMVYSARLGYWPMFASEVWGTLIWGLTGVLVYRYTRNLAPVLAVLLSTIIVAGISVLLPITVLGNLALVLALGLFAPTAWRAWVYRHEVVPRGIPAVITIANILYTAYGIGLGDMPVAVSSAVCGVFGAIGLIRWPRKKTPTST